MDTWRRAAGAASGQGAGDRSNERTKETNGNISGALALWERLRVPGIAVYLSSRP